MHHYPAMDPSLIMEGALTAVDPEADQAWSDTVEQFAERLQDFIAVDVQPPISDNEGDNDDDTSEGSEEARLALATNHASVVEGDSTNRSGQA